MQITDLPPATSCSDTIIRNRYYHLTSAIPNEYLARLRFAQRTDAVAQDAFARAASAVVNYTADRSAIVTDDGRAFGNIPPAIRSGIVFSYDDNGEQKQVILPDTIMMQLAESQKIWKNQGDLSLAFRLNSHDVQNYIYERVVKPVTPDQIVYARDTRQAHVFLGRQPG